MQTFMVGSEAGVLIDSLLCLVGQAPRAPRRLRRCGSEMEGGEMSNDKIGVKVAVCLAIGVSVGAVIGLTTQTAALWTGTGAALGAAIAAALGFSGRRDPDDE